MEKELKHLVVAVGGIGLCIAGQIIDSWYVPMSQKSGDQEILTLPFIIAGVVLTIIGLFCCIGALLCQTGRYDKKK